MRDSYEEIISRALPFIASNQLDDGSFLNFSSNKAHDFTEAKSSRTTFATSLILLALNLLPSNHVSQRIRRKSATFLLSQKSKYWSFNYWVKGTPEMKLRPFPDDLDDTFCAVAALYEYDKRCIDGRAFAYLTSLLTQTEQTEGGPYYTWIVPEHASPVWRDIDVAVNSNIAYFLKLQDIELPNVIQYIENSIAGNALVSPYYPSPYPLLFFLSRWYRGSYTGILKAQLSRTIPTRWANPLNIALSILALENLGAAPPTDHLECLLNTYQGDHWDPFAFYMDPSRNGNPQYGGAAALTTAWCLAAIATKIHKEKISQSTLTGETDALSRNERNLLHGIAKQTKQLFRPGASTIATSASKAIDAMIQTKPDIALLPYRFVLSLGKTQSHISSAVIKKLGTANILGWIAYTIYDDFLDEEGDPVRLSLANISLRKLTNIFEKNFPLEISNTFHTIMDNLDAANMWEVLHCRIPPISTQNVTLHRQQCPRFGTYRQLGLKSLGHAIGPLTIILLLGYPLSSNEYRSTKNFFLHYLIARQLNDDLHDWKKDLRKGHINSVAAELFQDCFHKKNAQRLTITIDRLERLFWKKTALDICQNILNHARQARQSCKKNSLIEDPGFLLALIEKHENIARRTIEERNTMVKFLTVYEGGKN